MNVKMSQGLCLVLVTVTNNNNREFIEHVKRLKALYNLRKNMQHANTHHWHINKQNMHQSGCATLFNNCFKNATTALNKLKPFAGHAINRPSLRLRD